MKPLFVFKIMFTFVWLAILTGCESFGVETWQRDILAQPAMQFQARDLGLTTDDHFYFSKEGTSGGRGFAGGGCGCN